MSQLHLPLELIPDDHMQQSYRDHLVNLLDGELNFHNQDGRYASHNFHSFPAKFPPQLPRQFILTLTHPSDVVLDPMMGSGTTVVEAFLAGRHAIGFDIDPLALRIARTKVTPLDADDILQLTATILKQARLAAQSHHETLRKTLDTRWDRDTKAFIDYWFVEDIQLALLALLVEIEKLDDAASKAFFELAFSAIIITKTGGVSLALDLAHTRPHRAKVVTSKDGDVILGKAAMKDLTPSRTKILTKMLRSPFEEFEKRIQHNVKGLPYLHPHSIEPMIKCSNTQSLPLADDSVDLIVTSPPYASNAIDYMRAHKFALVWLGYSIADLGERRRAYIGGEALTDNHLEELPAHAANVVEAISQRDAKKGRVLYRYYSEMTRTLRETFRVLKPGKAAIFVVGSSVMRNKDTETPECLAEIGRTIGFDVPKIGVRQLDRNKRMLPSGSTRDLSSQIQQRMHEEYVIGFYKPEIPC